MQGAGGAEALQQRGQTLQAATLDYTDRSALEAALKGMDVVMHTAGPYLGEKPDILDVRPASTLACHAFCLLYTSPSPRD